MADKDKAFSEDQSQPSDASDDESESSVSARHGQQHTSGTETLVRSVSPPEPRRHSKEDSAQAAIRRPSSPNLEDSEAKGKLVHAVLKASHAAE